MRLSEGKIKHMNALSNDKGVIAAAAMDQRGSLRKAIASAKGVPQPR
jgi:tagatose 1,6-diphosphate aldolase